MRVVLLLTLVACAPRPTVLGAQFMDAGVDAGAPAFKAAAAVGPLSVTNCRKRFQPVYPAGCFGGSGPPPEQCVVAQRPDGGVTLVTSVPTSGDLVIRDLHGLEGTRVVVEVASVTSGAPVQVSAFEVDGGAPGVRLLTGSAYATVPTMTVADSTWDAVVCEGTCALREGRLDGTSSSVVANDVLRPSPRTTIVRSGSTRAWTTDAGVTTSASPLLVTSGPGLVAFDGEGTLFATEGSKLLRAPDGVRAELRSDLDAPVGLFPIDGHVLVVEARRVRAFPKQGGAPFTLYELAPSNLGTLSAPRLVGGRLFFDQVCERLSPTVDVPGNVELDFVLGEARWLNEDPAFPFVRGARPDAPGFRDVFTSPEVIVGLVE
ncbi:MAG: hypothetical protein GQE15_15605 [Archangiaceae bacterium]|nr:hypothetical protein [Archangiaceae bacterium]